MKHLKTMDEYVNEALNDQQKLDALQDLNVDVSVSSRFWNGFNFGMDFN